ncbi:MAG: 50S ribosomal protein L29 [Candidatus Methanofastidiosia archaeon]
MAILKPDEIRELSLDEMYDKLSELKAEYSRERALLATGVAPENPGRIGELKRTIARVATIITEEERGIRE